MNVLMITDDQIRDFKERPERLEEMHEALFHTRRETGCDLLDSWRYLHQLLTAGTSGDELPMCALNKGEVEYAKGLSEPAHAIYSATVRGLADGLSKLSEALLDERSRLNGMPFDFSFYVPFFRRLRDFASTASREGKGLVFCCYEYL